MLLEAIDDMGIDPSESWFVGDSITDAQAGRAAAVRTILIGDYPKDAAEVVVPDVYGVLGALSGEHA
jgi:phosphoglycolate phosphatase-like HAD superfamily hydrolase